MPFEIGKGIILNEGTDITVFATGHLVWKALVACKILEEKGISAEIINIHTIKPLDKELILNSVHKTLCAISVEEHQKSGGMGESIASLLSAELPVFFEVVGVNDVFGESGKPEELLTKFGLSENHIVEAALKILKKKTH
jgi:transketolase